MTAATDSNPLPLIYACSGCSSAAQMTSWLALRLDRLGVAQMSCIAGVGGDVKPLVRLAQSGRPVIVLDGCPLGCARACLDRAGVSPTRHIDLSTWGVRKKMGVDFDPAEAEAMLERLLGVIRSVSAAEAPGA